MGSTSTRLILETELLLFGLGLRPGRRGPGSSDGPDRSLIPVLVFIAVWPAGHGQQPGGPAGEPGGWIGAAGVTRPSSVGRDYQTLNIIISSSTLCVYTLSV